MRSYFNSPPGKKQTLRSITLNPDPERGGTPQVIIMNICLIGRNMTGSRAKLILQCPLDNAVVFYFYDIRSKLTLMSMMYFNVSRFYTSYSSAPILKQLAIIIFNFVEICYHFDMKESICCTSSSKKKKRQSEPFVVYC